MDLTKLIARVKAMLLTPKTEWPVVATEPTTPADLYKGYILWLAAIPVIFGFIKMTLIGVTIPFGGTVRSGVGAGLATMVLGYVLALIGVYVMAVIVDALAPTFGAQKDRVQALKTVAYAYTASWAFGVGQIVPGLWMLIGLAGAIYSIYLLYLGLPHTMKAPPEKAAGYTAVAIIIAVVLWFVIASIVGAVAGVGSFMGGAVTADRDAQTTFDEDSPLGKLEQWSKEVEQASKQMDAAQKSGDQEAQAEALEQMMGAALGSGQVESLAPDRLKPLLPESLVGLSRNDFSVERNSAMGLQVTEARATYANDEGRQVNLSITDAGSARGLLAFAGWSGMESESESSDGYEKTYRDRGRLHHERWDQANQYGEYAVVVGDRFTVEASGSAEDINDLKRFVAAVNLDALEAMKNEGVKN